MPGETEIMAVRSGWPWSGRETEIMAVRSGWPWSGGSRDDVQERRAQIYALNRHMKAIEEKRWRCCVAGRQHHVDAISKCMDVFSRCTPPAPHPLHAHRTPAWPIGTPRGPLRRRRANQLSALKHWSEHAMELALARKQQAQSEQAEMLRLAGLGPADLPLLQTMPEVSDRFGVRRRYCLLAQACSRSRPRPPYTAPPLLSTPTCCMLIPIQLPLPHPPTLLP
jgi:hypothetical protein